MNAPAREKVEVVSFGCRLNLVESEAMRRAAERAGHSDTIVFNTCAVTAESVRQARQAIRRVSRERPGAKIVVSGCAAEIERARFADMPEVAAIVGNAAKTEAETWRALKRGETPVADIAEARIARPVTAARIEGHTRAFLAIQNGCDHRCTFCVIPYGRGPSRSIPAETAIAQARRLIELGHKEIVLTGVDLTSWGGDLHDAPKLGLLVRALLKALPELWRLRLSSLDCIEADEDLMIALAEEERLMPHLHLSLQAGDDVILKRMKRRHSRRDAIEFCDRVRKLRPDIVFGADLIAGFPTETDPMAENTLRLVEDCGLTHLHVFPYSPREMTPAARMPQVARDVRVARAKALREAGERALTRHLDAQVGRRVEVLAERGGVGRTADFTLVATPDVEPGAMIEGVVAGRDGMKLRLR
ncbi:MAG: tRNA (N(6)-L-threonylcarbamoyladenosine(37)-C(2))-methylthiotransferase MtaB [Methylobacteriaceae bacterium]|nr:tRNA (N(6)-L-threonylcarbamoyladenosine(37)-C(2))-methylthiotransferase MtaB [Methylobacteriaceae bacterium]